MAKLTPQQQAERLDSRKWEAAASLVRAYGRFQKTREEYGTFHDKTREALEETEQALRRFKRIAKK